MSVKYQIVLPEALADELKRVSGKLKIPRSQLIRDAVEAQLKAYRNSRTQDPFANITGLVESGDRDISQRVDEIVYE